MDALGETARPRPLSPTECAGPIPALRRPSSPGLMSAATTPGPRPTPPPDPDVEHTRALAAAVPATVPATCLDDLWPEHRSDARVPGAPDPSDPTPTGGRAAAELTGTDVDGSVDPSESEGGDVFCVKCGRPGQRGCGINDSGYVRRDTFNALRAVLFRERAAFARELCNAQRLKLTAPAPPAPPSASSLGVGLAATQRSPQQRGLSPSPGWHGAASPRGAASLSRTVQPASAARSTPDGASRGASLARPQSGGGTPSQPQAPTPAAALPSPHVDLSTLAAALASAEALDTERQVAEDGRRRVRLELQQDMAAQAIAHGAELAAERAKASELDRAVASLRAQMAMHEERARAAAREDARREVAALKARNAELQAELREARAEAVATEERWQDQQRRAARQDAAFSAAQQQLLQAQHERRELRTALDAVASEQGRFHASQLLAQASGLGVAASPAAVPLSPAPPPMSPGAESPAASGRRGTASKWGNVRKLLVGSTSRRRSTATATAPVAPVLSPGSRDLTPAFGALSPVDRASVSFAPDR